jgi:hypothetical protein
VFTLILVMKNPLVFPITDDVGYIPWGTHTLSPNDIIDFSLVAGHQQVLTKFTVWLIGFFPGNYVTYISYVNYALYISGCFFLVRASFERQKTSTSVFLICLVLLFSMKQLYMFFMITALGPIQAFFCISLYCSLQRSVSSKGRALSMLVLFITPSTTGLGLVLPLSVIVRNIFLILTRKKVKVQNLLEVLISLFSLMIFYGIPSYLNLVLGSAKRPSSTIESIITSSVNPHWTLLMVFALMGNVFFASSRFDPMIPSFIGVTLFSLIYSLFYRKPLKFVNAMFEKHLSLLPGIFFLLTILIYRGGGTYEGWINSVSPRYIMGSLLLIVPLFSIIEVKVVQKRFLSMFLIVLAGFSFLGGQKTGLEWFSVRSQQQSSLTECMDRYRIQELRVDSKCFEEAFLFTDTKNKTDFSNRFNTYLEYRRNI